MARQETPLITQLGHPTRAHVLLAPGDPPHAGRKRENFIADSAAVMASEEDCSNAEPPILGGGGVRSVSMIGAVLAGTELAHSNP